MVFAAGEHEPVIAGGERGVDAAPMNRASRSGVSPDLVGGPWWPVVPQAVSEGARPVNERAPARDWNGRVAKLASCT